MKTLKDFDFQNKRVLVRCDFNVPLDNNGNILDDFKIKKTLPTIKYLIENKGKIILISHLDDLNGKTPTLDNVKERLEKLLGALIKKTEDCLGEEVKKEVLKLKQGDILLLENLRIRKEEVDNNLEFAKKLSNLGEIYINDAFGTCHRAHASIASVPKYLPCGMGFLMQNEIENLNKILQNPKKPVIVIIGGVKVDTKANFIENILEIADFVIVNGLVKKEMIEKNLKFKYPEKIIGPDDNLEALDILDDTIKIFRQKILTAKTILWNGPLGKFEDINFKKGTLEIAKAIIESGAFSVVGGGETIEFLNKEGIISKFNHVSTGGGAMLEFLSGVKLPGIKALN